MGIYDRDYYQTETTGSSGPLPTSVWGRLILANGLVFLVQAFASGSGVTELLVLDSERVWEVWRLVTAGFCHSPADIWHIVMNMLFLWWAGRELEAVFGRREFLAFYMTALVVSSLAFLVNARVIGFHAQALGASGAVMGVLVAFAWLFPRRKILLFLILPIEVRWLVALYALFDLYPVILALVTRVPSATGVGHSAHLGGLAFGLLYMKFEWRILSWLPALPDRPAGRRKKRRRGESPAGDRLAEEIGQQARLDDLLDKIHRSGQDSLSAEERQFLIDMSQRYRDRQR